MKPVRDKAARLGAPERVELRIGNEELARWRDQAAIDAQTFAAIRKKRPYG